jgi:[citrate (pro-3S)-lyase] ligase
MDPYDFRLEELPRGGASSRSLAEAFLAAQGLAMDASLQRYYGVFRGSDLVGGAGYDRNVIKCAAVSGEYRGEGILNALTSRIITDLHMSGYTNVFVFTRPENRELFHGIGFHAVESTGDVLLMESDKNGFRRYLDNLAKYRNDEGNGAVVMNGNPFTLGHRHLVREAAGQSGRLLLFLVEEDLSVFPFSARFRLVEEGTADLGNVAVIPGGSYIVSAATFPSYFLGDASVAARAHAELDTAIFGRHIAPAAGVIRRFAGEEPFSPVTRIYNEAMTDLLPGCGLGITVIPRLERRGEAICASRVRRLLAENKIEEVRELVPETTYRYLVSSEAEPTLRNLARLRFPEHAA